MTGCSLGPVEVQRLLGPVADLEVDTEEAHAEVVACFHLDGHLGRGNHGQGLVGLDEAHRRLLIGGDLDPPLCRFERHAVGGNGCDLELDVLRHRRDHSGELGSVDMQVNLFR